MKKTKWTQNDFCTGDQVVLTVKGGMKHHYTISEVTYEEFKVDTGGSISYYQIIDCDYDIEITNRHTPTKLKVYRLKDFK